MSEIIHELPVDNIPLGADEKDVFQWLYPTTPKKIKDKQPDRRVQMYINLFFMAVLIFSAVYPKFQFMWIKMIPFKEESPVFSVMKVFVIFFLLYVFNYVFICKN